MVYIVKPYLIQLSLIAEFPGHKGVYARAEKIIDLLCAFSIKTVDRQLAYTVDLGETEIGVWKIKIIELTRFKFFNRLREVFPYFVYGREVKVRFRLGITAG